MSVCYRSVWSHLYDRWCLNCSKYFWGSNNDVRWCIVNITVTCIDVFVDSFKPKVFQTKSLFCFSPTLKQSKEKWELQPPSIHHPLHLARLYRCSSKVTVVDAASGKAVPSDKVFFKLQHEVTAAVLLTHTLFCTYCHVKSSDIV